MVPREFDIEGRTVIITGAARGIGKGIARVLAEAGARVLVTALTDQYLKPMSKEFAAAGHPIEVLSADATTGAGWEKTIALALDRWDHIDGLINCLGDAIGKPLVPLPDGDTDNPISDEEYRFVLDVNLTEAFLGCRAVGPHFIERGRGKVINISGIAARGGSPGSLVYATAKAGLVRLTQTLALEWAPYGINVNCVAPGYFPDAELSDAESLAASRERARTQVPLGRVGDVREVGLLALYLISAASDYMTGETVYLSGGLVST